MSKILEEHNLDSPIFMGGTDPHRPEITPGFGLTSDSGQQQHGTGSFSPSEGGGSTPQERGWQAAHGAGSGGRVIPPGSNNATGADALSRDDLMGISSGSNQNEFVTPKDAAETMNDFDAQSAERDARDKGNVPSASGSGTSVQHANAMNAIDDAARSDMQAAHPGNPKYRK